MEKRKKEYGNNIWIPYLVQKPNSYVSSVKLKDENLPQGSNAIQYNISDQQIIFKNKICN